MKFIANVDSVLVARVAFDRVNPVDLTKNRLSTSDIQELGSAVAKGWLIPLDDEARAALVAASLTPAAQNLPAASLPDRGELPSVTLAQLKSTYLARDHFPAMAYCPDIGDYVRSTGTGWKAWDGTMVANDPDLWVFERGVALAGFEFTGSGRMPGTLNTDYFAPTNADFAYLRARKMTIVRLGFLWERIQPTLNGELDAQFKGYIDAALALAKANGIRVILDLHNFGSRIVGGVSYKVGTTQVPISAFADFWTRMAIAYKGNKTIYAYDLMNEPTNMPVPADPGSYNQNISDLQVVSNPSFESGTSRWSLDPDWSLVQDGARGTVAKLNGRTGEYSNLTTSNDAESGYPVKPSTTYMLSFEYSNVKVSGNGPQVHVNETDAYNGKLVSTPALPATVGYQRYSIQFTTGANTSKVYLRAQNLGGQCTFMLDKINITPGATLQPYRDFVFTGQYATTTLMNQAGIDAVRAVDGDRWLIIEFDRYSNLSQFTANFGTNPTVWWNDPKNRTMPSFHHYLDENHSGGYQTPWTQSLRDRMASEVLPAFDWAVRNGLIIFMGEYGVPSDMSQSSIEYRKDFETFLTYMDRYKFPGCCFAMGINFYSETSVHPTNNYTVDLEAMKVLMRHPSLPR